ncbi:uncharacterized protein LOC105830196 [Monomorium pharaonis]|uniref:uncharacterized protein LOC105830196 n=1 Tax=Monomorium pharaonis TaxID=307658 RepID=UPI00063FAC24|nr:uncharacterized protein LOC105830196 [Monomorium pharaonis]
MFEIVLHVGEIKRRKIWRCIFLAMFYQKTGWLQGRNQSALRMTSRPDPTITIGSLGSQTFSRTPGSALMTDDRKTRPEGLTGKRDYLGLLAFFLLLVYSSFRPDLLSSVTSISMLVVPY